MIILRLKAPQNSVLILKGPRVALVITANGSGGNHINWQAQTLPVSFVKIRGKPNRTTLAQNHNTPYVKKSPLNNIQKQKTSKKNAGHKNNQYLTQLKQNINIT